MINYHLSFPPYRVLALTALLVATLTTLAQPLDFDEILQRGTLRILVPVNLDGERFLPRKVAPVAAQEDIARAFANAHGLKTELVPIAQFRDMIPALQQGRGDLLAANLTVTKARRKQIAFSLPLTQIREKVLVRKDEKNIKKVSDLNGRTVMVLKGSTFWDSLTWLQKHKYQQIRLLPRPAEVQDEQEIDKLVSGEIDATLRDSNVAEMYLAYRDDFRIAFNFSRKRNIAWGVHKDARKLLAELNKYLQLEDLAGSNQERYSADLDEIRKRKVLRILLRNNAASYFMYRGELMGFEYDMARAFAKHLGARLEVVVPPNNETLLTWLQEGRGDIAVGFLEPLDTASGQPKIAYSKPYHHAPRHLVAASKAGEVRDISELQGRVITVRRSSGYWSNMQQLLRNGAGFELQAAPEHLETEELIAMVADGQIEMTVADEHLLDIELAQGLAIQSVLTLPGERPHAVAMRNSSPQLLAEIDRFIDAHRKGYLYNVLYKKYFKDKGSIRKLARGRVDKLEGDALSPWDELTKKFARQYGFDWRLITAQMYEESRFDPEAKSFAGAKGLMQLMPKTAVSLGFEDVTQPESGIHAGVKYMDWLRDRFGSDLTVSERLWFSLAAYNAGYGHVLDARRLAREKGWDSNRWFDNTDKAMLLLAKKEYAKQARYGYVRGSESVNYVKNIRQRLRAYIELTESTVALLRAE